MRKSINCLKYMLLLVMALILWMPMQAKADDEWFNKGYYEGLEYYIDKNQECIISDVESYYEGEIVIPSEIEGMPVTGISDYAFDGCDGLTSITIPEGVTSIGDYAFCRCSSLTNITIPKGITSIGDLAFYGCSGLTSITIPEGVTSIGDEAFWGCSGLTSITIPEGVTSIGYCAFSGCSGLTSIIVPEGVTSIGYCAFECCVGLTSITIPESVISMDGNVFWACDNLKKIDIDKNNKYYFSGDDLKTVYKKEGDGRLELLFVSKIVTNIKILEGVTSIGDSAFDSCVGLTSIIIPEGVTSIGDGAFEFCVGLTSIIIPESVTSIGDYAFGVCSSLESITLPDEITYIDNNAFYDCEDIIVYCNKGTKTENSLKEAGISYRYIGSEGVTTPTDAPKEIVDISKAENDVKVSGIENKIYNGKAQTQATMVVMAGDNTLELDKDYTVNYTDNVKKGKATVTITGIGNYKGTITRTFSIIAPKTDISKSSSKISVTGIVNQKYTGNKCTQTKLVVKSGSKTLRLGKDYKVSYENNVKPGKAAVVITGIGNYTGKIKKTFAISVPKNAVYTVGGMKYKVTNAAANGKGSVTIVGTTKKKKTFTSLTVGSTVTIGGIKYNITAVGKNAFRKSTYLKKIVIGNTVKTIGSGAFTGCKAVTTLAIGTGVTSVGDKAFYGCTKLKTVTVKSKKITKLGKQSFGKISAKPVASLPKAKAKSYKKLFKSAGISSKVVYKNMK